MSPWVFRPLELLERLSSAEVRFIVVGGFAVGAWGYVRGTRDLDIVPDPEQSNLDRLATMLEELGGRVMVADRPLEPSAIGIFLRAGDRALVRTERGEVDVLQGLPQIPRFAELAARASRVELEGVPVLVCSLEDLLAMKRAANRPIDQVDIDALEAGHAAPPDEREQT